MTRSSCAWLALGVVCGVLGVACGSSGDDAPPNQGGGGSVNTPTSGSSGGNPSGTSGGGAGTTPGGGTGGTIVGGGSGGTPPPGGGTGGTAGTPPTGGAGTTAGSGGAPPVGDGSSWPMMGYDERNWYFNPNETTLSPANASTLVEKWRFTVGGYPPGTPVVGEGRVYVMATGGTYAIDLEAGTMVWARTELTGTASVAWEPGFIYIHDAQANLYKLNSADGTTVWGPVKSYEFAGCDGTSSPIIGGGKVVVGHSCGALEIGFTAPASPPQGGVEARNTSDGGMGWSYRTTAASGEDGAMVWSTVGIDVAGGVVFAGSGNNYSMQGANSDAIHAIDLASGMQVWKQQVRNNDTWSFYGNIGGPDTDFGANPIVTDTLVAAGDKGSGFWALNRSDGQVAWNRDGLSAARDQAHGGFLMNGAFDGSTYYGTCNDTSTTTAIVYAMAADGGADKFPPKRFEGKFAWGAPSLANGLLVVPVDDDLHILDAATGDELKTFNTGGTIAAGAAAIVAGKIIVKSGLMYPLGTVKNNNQIIAYGLP